MPAVIAEWSRRHPGLAADAGDSADDEAEAPTPIPVEPAS
jgi:hypothetical protein